MTSIQIRRHELRFLPDCSRVLIRPFIPADRSRLTQIIGRALALSEEETQRELEIVRREFSARESEGFFGKIEKLRHFRLWRGQDLRQRFDSVFALETMLGARGRYIWETSPTRDAPCQM
jgi:hypothetical protein